MFSLNPEWSSLRKVGREMIKDWDQSGAQDRVGYVYPTYMCSALSPPPESKDAENSINCMLKISLMLIYRISLDTMGV